MPSRPATLLAPLALVAACAGARPEPQNQSALYRDLERLVKVAAAAGWNIDRYEVDDLMPDALESVCRVSPGDRRGLQAWIDARILDAGGPLEVAFRERGEKRDEVEDLIELTRIKLVLARAVTSADADCPMWVKPQPSFRGRQLLDDRWVLSFGGGGRGILIAAEDELDLSAGGAGRLLVGRAFGPRWMLSVGAELGALAAFPKDENGERANLVLGAELVTPLVVRYRLVNSYFEVEAGYLGQVSEDSGGVISGVHGGVSVGAQATRARWFLPGAAFGVAVERTFGDDRLWIVKAGFRVAIDLSL